MKAPVEHYCIKLGRALNKSFCEIRELTYKELMYQMAFDLTQDHEWFERYQKENMSAELLRQQLIKKLNPRIKKS